MLRTALVALATLVPIAFALRQDAAPTAPREGPPAAAPEDVASVDAIVAALYDVISGDAGEARDWDRFRSLFHTELGRLVPIGPDAERDGGRRALPISPDEYVARASASTAKRGFHERELARREEQFGGLVHVWSTYAACEARDAEEPFARGINSIQLLDDGRRWWVLGVVWEAETDAQPIPERYLPD